MPRHRGAVKGTRKTCSRKAKQSLSTRERPVVVNEHSIMRLRDTVVGKVAAAGGWNEEVRKEVAG